MKYIKKLDDNPFKNFTFEDFEVYCNKMELGYFSGSMIIQLPLQLMSIDRNFQIKFIGLYSQV